MKKKSVILALLALFLFQTQAMASVDHERDLLAGKARQPIARQEGDDAHPATPLAEEEDTAANRERDILSGKAQRALPVKKETKEEREKQENEKTPVRSITEEPATPADREREILSGKAQRSLPIRKETRKEDGQVPTSENTTTKEKDILTEKTQEAVSAQEKKPIDDTNMNKAEKEKTIEPAKEAKEKLTPADEVVPAKKDKRPAEKISMADREKEILSGKAQPPSRSR